MNVVIKCNIISIWNLSYGNGKKNDVGGGQAVTKATCQVTLHQTSTTAKTMLYPDYYERNSNFKSGRKGDL